ncbi:MAG: DUF4198 domain-containing protein [Deltaproteobacteria bacterium]|nr:DUF4198 domain-containing protein [Deltaproteobacteria bacterium]MBW1952248.1 DUF4198 domain-containing protein [Deltaproteobacteria bacterium]
MLKLSSVLLVVGLVLGWTIICQAHFGVVLPSPALVVQGDGQTVKVQLSFCHPFEQEGMNLARPQVFGVMIEGKKTDLLKSLKETKIFDHQAWKASYALKKPGVYTFYMEPQPYWEPAEDKYIIHYTKAYVAAFGEEEGWDQEVGLKTEILPLTRPFGLYAGNVFRGLVKLNGQPRPNTEVEITYWNAGGQAVAPNEYFPIQVVKTDQNGVFSFAAPHPGWWGFAALSTEKQAIKNKKGQKKDAELGAVLWVQFSAWQTK